MENNIPPGVADPAYEPEMIVCPDCGGDTKNLSECCGASIDSDILICSDCKEHSDIAKCETCEGEGTIIE